MSLRASKRDRKIAKGSQKGTETVPKGAKREPKGCQKSTKVHPKVDVRKMPSKSEAPGGSPPVTHVDSDKR